MHPQIKQIIGTIRVARPGVVFLDLSSGEQTPMGKLLFSIYYRTRLTDLLDGSRTTINGFPHNGGMHTLALVGDRGDIVAWLEIAKDTLMDLPRGFLTPEMSVVLSEFPFIAQEVLAKKA